MRRPQKLDQDIPTCHISQGLFSHTYDTHFTLTSDILPGVTRSYNSFNQTSYENAISRIYLGIHFWFDESAGMTMGKEIATDVFNNDLIPKSH